MAIVLAPVGLATHEIGAKEGARPSAAKAAPDWAFAASRKSGMDIRAVCALQALAGTEDVIEQPLKFKTASYDALEAAFELNPEAIFFLSDGAPFGGKIDAPAEIIATIGGWNRVRRVSIHSIGVGVKEPQAEVFAAFLKELAETNWGIYKPVN